jgi:hypothetical protein
MYWVVITFLLVLWILGWVTSNSFHGLIHLLFVIAILLLFHRVLRGPAVMMKKKGNGIHQEYRKPWTRGEAHD